MPANNSTINYGSLPFDAQIAFFKQKLALPSKTWDTLWQGNHDHGFVVAGAMRQAMVEDFQTAAQKAIEKGTTIADFRKDFDATVERYGWDYKGSRNWRSRVIYETNMRTSHAAGRYTQLQKFSYWQYHHSIGVANPRPQHVSWDRLILRKDDPFWQTHYPPNGWGCRCTVTGLSAARMKAKGLTSDQTPTITTRKVKVGTSPSRTVDVPEGIDAGWAYAPGRSAWLAQQTPSPMQQALTNRGQVIPATKAHDLLPDPTPMNADVLLPPMKKGEEETYVRKFLDVFDADIDQPAVYTDVTHEPIIVSDKLFRDQRGRWKLANRNRAEHLLLLADALDRPDEVWTWIEWHAAQEQSIVHRNYIKRVVVDGKTYAAIIILRRQNHDWYGVTAHLTDSNEFSKKIERNRAGVRLYKRP